MKTVIFILFLYFPIFLSAQTSTETLTNADIVKLSGLNLPSSAIISKIKNSQSHFDVSVDGLVDLKKQGVNGDVINEMINANTVKPIQEEGNVFEGEWVATGNPNCSLSITKQDKNYILKHTNSPCGYCLPADGIYNLDANGNLIDGSYKLAYVKDKDNIIMSGAPYPLKRISTNNPGNIKLQDAKIGAPNLTSGKAKELSLPTIDGNMVSLSSFRGKYVLLEFWASWCSPCRVENPFVVAAFDRFKDKNFTVYSVSLDDNKAAWEKAIKVDHLTGTQTSELKRWSSVAATTYSVVTLPTNFLIDPNGMIIASDLHGKQIEKTLEKLLTH